MEQQPTVRPEATAVSKTPVSAVEEIASSRNPYLAEDVRVHGYSVRELMGHLSYSEMLFLNLRGELPNRHERRLLDDVLVALSAPGPRHAATRAVMYASASKTMNENILPLGLTVLSGDHLGSKECHDAMKFIRRALAQDPRTHAVSMLKDCGDRDKAAPGFGSRFSGIDPLPAHFLSRFARRKGVGPHVLWANRFAKRLASRRMGALTTGLAAAVFLDLGFTEAQGCGVFQIAAAPQLVALAAELGKKGLAAMPFLPEANYHIEGGVP